MFHTKFDLHCVDEPAPRRVPQTLFDFRFKFLEEELSELQTAYESGDHAGVADALVDLVYVALGTAHLFGLPWQALWNEVQRANMTKERAIRAEQSSRGSTFDVVKPEGWTPPDIQRILAQHGWPEEGGSPRLW